VKRVENKEEEKKYALVANNDSVYKADITNPGSSSVNTFIAIRNKTTRTIQLVQVQEALFNHALYDSTHSIYEKNVVDVKKVLHKDFGGKKALASYERQKRSAPNVEVLEETLEKQINQIESEKFFENDIFDQTQTEREKFQSSIFPNIDASSGNSIRDLFNASKLLGKDMMSHLSDVAIQVLQTDPKNLPFCNSYLNNSVKSIQIKKQPDSKENIERVALFIYMDALIRLINCKKNTLDAAELSKMSNTLEQELRKNFSIQGNRVNSKFTRQKSLIYYIILSLTSTDSLEIDLENVLEGLNVSKTELIKYATVIGAKLKNKSILYIHRANLNSEMKMSAPMPSGVKRRRK
jgi:hypothetical protein